MDAIINQLINKGADSKVITMAREIRSEISKEYNRVQARVAMRKAGRSNCLTE